MILTARGAEQHSNGTDTAQAYLNLALALGPARPAVLRLRHDHRAGQRAGRPRARAEGRPAARLPQARRPGRPRARRRGLGDRPGRAAPARACRPTRCSTGSAPPAASGPCWCWPATSPSPRRTPTGCVDRLRRAGLPGRLRHLPVRDRRAGRRRAAHRPVGRGGGHDDQPRGPGASAAGGPCRRRRTCATDLQRAQPSWPTGSAAASSSAPTRATVFDELRRASAGGIADYAGITYERIDAEQGVFWPCPSRGPPGHAAAVRRRLPHPRRPGAVHPGRAPRPGRDARRATTRTC